MSIPPSNNLFLDRTAENDNNRIMNVGHTYSEVTFDPINAKQKFCWELAAKDFLKILRENARFFGIPVKEIEYYSDVLYRAQFCVHFENGAAHVCAKIHREEFGGDTPVNEFSYYFITNGNGRLYGNVIPAAVIQDILSKIGWIKAVADLAMPEHENLVFE